MSFQYEIDHNDNDGALIKFSGQIDEYCDFTDIKLPESNRITIDLKSIQMLNSVGLRSWVMWVKTLNQQIIVLRHCPAVAVHQMNILDGFMPLKSIVESFEVPYHCEACGADSFLWAVRGEHFFERTADKAQWLKVPDTVSCEKCNKTAGLDVIPVKYFHFLKSRI